jgi:hypothetical protein
MMVQVPVLPVVVHWPEAVLVVLAAVKTVPAGRGLTVDELPDRVPPPCTLMLGSAAAGVIAVT